ncbi:MAG: hypothetical protein GC161_16375 [Planctomycetaceae bacterium]|nr:hypothetical protein [Planctomycetaceae bacterium]
MTPEEIRVRRPVWSLLSELWLDVELDDRQRELLALELSASAFSVAELRDIHDCEVAPVVSRNLDSVAGEWSGFDPDWLAERCAKAADDRGALASRIRRWGGSSRRRKLVTEVLDDVLARVARLRG